MASKKQAYPPVGANRQVPPATGDDEVPAQADTLKVVACPICRAIYLPVSEQQSETLVATGLLETAFLKVCHFCFRCQRFACPQCWNPVHHVCAACSEEARLPFRAPVPSLEGLAFTPPRTRLDYEISFLCRRNGRFYTPDPVSQQESHASSLSITSEPITSDALPVLPLARATSPADAYPLWLQEVLGCVPGGQDETVYATPTEDQALAPVQVDQPGASVLSPLPTDEDDAQDDSDDLADEDVSLLERVENVLIVITSVLLLAVVLMIVLSITLAPVNAFFLRFLHLDIRTEVAYLLQLR